MTAKTAFVTEIAEVPLDMPHGGEMYVLSDGSLIVFGKDSWRTFSGACIVNVETGVVTELAVPIVGSFQAIYCDHDEFLTLDRNSGEVSLWNPLRSSIILLDTKSGAGQWVAHDKLDNVIYILANLDLSGNSAGFDYEHHVSCLGCFDLKSRSFIDEFKSVRGHDIRGMVVQDNDTILAVGYGRLYGFCAHFSMKLEEIGNESSRHVDGLSLEHSDGITFIGRCSNNSLLALCKDNKAYAVTYITKGSKHGRILWKQSALKRSYVIFEAAIQISPQQLLLILKGRSQHLILLYTEGGGIEEIKRINTESISCGVHTPNEEIYVTGSGLVHRLNFPKGSFQDHA